MFQMHPREIHLQFLGEQHRHRGVGALSHLDLRHDQRDPPVPADANEGTRREIYGFGGIGRIDPTRQAGTEQQPSANREPRRQDGAAADLLGSNLSELGKTITKHGSPFLSCCLGERGVFDRLANTDISAAAADIAGHGVIDIAVARIGIGRQQG
jgi:hypothetical protein